MTLEQVGAIIIACVIYICATAYYIYKKDDLTYLNPVRNYDKWNKMNWFGVSICTFILNIIFLPYAILYWLVLLIIWLFTVGRE